MNKENCVYLIVNKINDKKYVGVAKDFDKRMYQHKIGHDKEHSPIDRAIVKYGWENFEISIVDNYSSLEERKEKEIYYISFYNTYNTGYNATLGGDFFPILDTKEENNPRALLTKEDVIDIRKRRMNGERLDDVYEIYKDTGISKRGGFSAIWLHKSWPEVCSDFIGKYPLIDNSQYATKRKNLLTKEDNNFLINFFKWNGPIKYNEIYKNFKEKIDWQSFQEICKQIVDNLFGNKNTRRYRNKTGETQKRILKFREALKEEPVYIKS